MPLTQKGIEERESFDLLLTWTGISVTSFSFICRAQVLLQTVATCYSRDWVCASSGPCSGSSTTGDWTSRPLGPFGVATVDNN